MTIMVAGGVTFAVPGVTPVAYAQITQSNPHLYVSAEGQDADNQFAQGNIIEVIVNDPTISDTDEGKAEPNVSVDGTDLRMLQTANGEWRAYFAQADAIASINAMNGELDYGVYCSADDASDSSGLELGDSNGVYFPTESDVVCGDKSSDDDEKDDNKGYHPLIRKTRALTEPATSGLGQLGLSDADLWPFIQVFDFAPESKVEIVYDRAGSKETVTLKFDDPSESHKLDRTKYPQGAHVLVTIEDYALNIDPTDEDTWAFDTKSKEAYYRLFDEDGKPVNIMNSHITNYGGSAGIGERIVIERTGQGGDPLIDCRVTEDFGIKEANEPSMDYLVSNDESNGACVPTDNIPSSSYAHQIFTEENFIIGFVENTSNDNEFINWADQKSNLVVRDDAQRNRSFEIDYNAPGAISGVVGHFFAELTLGDSGATWNSGERIDFVVTDEDANTNPLAENDLTVANPDTMLVPSIRIGDPTTLSSATGNVVWVDLPDDAPVDSTLPRITITGDNPAMVGWNTSYTDAGATCTDNMDSTPTMGTPVSNVDVATTGSYTVTYTCTDDAGNSATVSRAVTVTSPVITITGDASTTVAKGAPYNDAGATCVDDVDGAITTITTTPGVISTANVGEQTITYTCTDSEGNTATAMRTVMVTDQAMPIITIRGGSTATVAQGATYNDAGATCVDADDQSDITAITSNASAIDTSMVGTQTIVYSCTDAQGNTFTQIKTVTIEDKTKPVIVITGDNPDTISQSTMPYPDPGAVCTDNHDANKTATAASDVNRRTVGDYTVTYTCSDMAGNPADSVVRDVQVITDDTKPEIRLIGESRVEISHNAKMYDDMGATCEDNLDADKPAIADTTNVDLTALGSYTVTYTCTDAAENPADPVMRTVVVGPDTTDPMITGAEHRTIMVGDSFDPEMGVACVDETTLDTTLTVVSNVDTATAADYRVAYSCTDGADNQVSQFRTVTVSDATIPEISITSAVQAVNEGDNAVFTLTANPAQTTDLDVTVTVSETGGYTTNTGDRTVTIPTTGSVMFDVATTDDGNDNGGGSVTATISTGSGGYTVSSSEGMATVTVRDNDGGPILPNLSISAGAGSISEGGDAVFTIMTDHAPQADLAVSVTITQTGDYADSITSPDTVTILAGATTATITISTENDNVDEPDGSISAMINPNAAQYTTSTSTASVTVTDDDLPVTSLTITSITGTWDDGNEVTLEISGTSQNNPTNVRLYASDIGYTSAPLMVDSTTGGISGMVTIDDIRVSEDTEFMLIADGDVESMAKTGMIPRLLTLTNLEVAGAWSNGMLKVVANGTSNFASDVTLVAVDGDGSVTTLDNDAVSSNDIKDVVSDGEINHEFTLHNFTLADKPVMFKLQHSGLGDRTAESADESETLPALLKLGQIGVAQDWAAGEIRVDLKGSAGLDTNVPVQLVAAVAGSDEYVNVGETILVGDNGVVDTGDDGLTMNNIALAGETVMFKLNYTTTDPAYSTLSNDKSRPLPVLLTLSSVDVAPVWGNGELKIDVTGKAGVEPVELVVIDSDGSETSYLLTVTAGAIDHSGLTFENLTLAEKPVTFKLKSGAGDSAAYSDDATAPRETLPKLLELTEVDISTAGWNTDGTLALTISGNARTASGTVVVLLAEDAAGSKTSEEVTVPAGGVLFNTPVSLENITLAEKPVTFTLQATAGEIVAESSDSVMKTLPRLFELTKADAVEWDNTVLKVNITGTSSLALTSVTLVATHANGTEIAGVTNGDLTSEDLKNIDEQVTLTFENTDLAGTSVTFKLKGIVSSSAYSNGIADTLPSATANVDMTPTPVSFSTNNGFPPITRAVINDISEIPTIHSVLKVIPADKTVGYDFSASDGVSMEAFSDRLRLAEPTELVLDIRGESAIVIEGWERPMFMDGVTTLFNWNFDSLSEHATVMGAYLGNGTHKIPIATGASGLVELNQTEIDMLGGTQTDLIIKLDGDVTHVCSDITLVADFFTFGQTPDGDRVNNAIYRLEVEEATPNSADFEATLEYVMLNQLNVHDAATYTSLRTIDSDVSIIVHEDFTDEDSVRINYLDLGADGVSTQVAIQREAPTHSGVVSFDMDSYKVADTVTITVEDADLNADNDVVDIYTIAAGQDTIGDGPTLLLDVTFDDETWTANGCTDDEFNGADTGLGATDFTLMETAKGSGVFTGDFQIPEVYCQASSNSAVSVTGVDIEVNYQDFRDASGEEIEVGAGAAIRANTGTVSLDRTVYPVPFDPAEYGTATDDSLAAYDVSGDLGIHIRVTDADFDVSAAGEDTIVNASEYLTVKIIRGAESTTIDLNSVDITEVAPDAGVFELDLTISHNVGGDIGQIQQGDIIQVEYEDPTDASGEINTVTDSATFDLRNAVLQSDKSVYIIGSDMILTLIEPDFDLDNDGAETYPLDLIEWDSDAATVAMGSDPALDPEPNGLRETGDSTGIFQSIIEIPGELEGDRLERGEEIELEYVDYGPSGSDYVGDETEDITLTVFTSNFGATIELDQKVYTWTDKVYITIVAPDHNFDSALVDEIGESDDDPIRISTRSDDIDNYKLVETGADTGIFTGEIILIGFDHNADGETTTGTTTTGYDNPQRETSGSDSGPTNGYIKTDDDDGITVSFEFSEDETVVGSALIRWNIGEVQWLEASYPATGTGVVRVIDPDMNLNPESVDNFDVDVWSDKDAGGIDLTVTETNQATGIFEGTVFFTTADESSGHRLRVAEGDTVTAEYEDNTLPDPYTTADELDITATTLIGTIVPPLERAVVSNLRTVDAFENSLDTVSVDQQVQIVADLTSGQDRSQMFAYLVQVQDANGVTVSLAWISGTLEAGQSLSPSSSWIPTEAGTYTATAFVWESVDNPTALSPPVTTTITVS